MTYQGRPIEIIGVERVFGKEVLNIRMVDDNTCRKVDKNSNVVPSVKLIMTVRIDG